MIININRTDIDPHMGPHAHARTHTAHRLKLQAALQLRMFWYDTIFNFCVLEANKTKINQLTQI